MSNQTKFSPEVRERAVRIVQEQRDQYSSLWAAAVSIGPKFDCAPSTLVGWVRRWEVDHGVREGVTSQERERLKGALLHSIFECSPDTLGWACLQAGSSLEKLNNLYVELLVKGFPKNKNWERIMREACVTE